MDCEWFKRNPTSEYGPCEPGDCGINTCKYREEEVRYEKRELRHRYESLLPFVRAAARTVGYAIAVHGSLSRDMDLIAIPWMEEAVSAEALVEAIADGVRAGNGGIVAFREGDPTSKPHGRKSWVLFLGGHPYIDLAVMPLLPKKQEGIEAGNKEAPDHLTE